MVGAQGTEVGAFIVAHLLGLKCPLWLGEVTSQEQHQPVVSRISSQSNIKLEGNIVASSGHKGGSDCCSTLNRPDTIPWPGDEAFQEQPKPVVKSRTPLSQKSDTKPVVNAGASSEHGGGGDHCSTPPPLAIEEVLPEEVPLHDVLLQEQPKPAVKPSTPPSQNSHLNSGGNAGGSPELRGESDRCSTPTMADIPCGYGKETLQGQTQPGAISRMRSSQRNDTNSGGDVGGNSGHRSGGNLYSTPTRADASRC